jgi:death on curing protein
VLANKRVYGGSSSLFDLASSYGAAILRDHPFVGGNKRVALAVMYVFLEMNGYRLEAPEANAVETVLAMAAEELDEEDLSGWLKRFSVSLLT